jgi:hypothetical protein
LIDAPADIDRRPVEQCRTEIGQLDDVVVADRRQRERSSHSRRHGLGHSPRA